MRGWRNQVAVDRSVQNGLTRKNVIQPEGRKSAFCVGFAMKVCVTGLACRLDSQNGRAATNVRANLHRPANDMRFVVCVTRSTVRYFSSVTSTFWPRKYVLIWNYEDRLRVSAKRCQTRQLVSSLTRANPLHNRPSTAPTASPTRGRPLQKLSKL